MTVTDNDLITAACAGNHIAFEELVHRYDAQVMGIALRFGNSRDDAKDIYQEVFLRVFRNLSSFEGKSMFSTWLYRITVNVCLSHQSQVRRERSYRVRDGGEDGADRVAEAAGDTVTSPDRLTESAEVSGRIARALEALAPKQRLVFTLKHTQGLSLKEIAGVMRCTEGTVKRYLFMASRRLRSMLQEYAEVPS
jgi:RNA polymerase sigma-70 factor (ECF subfamily)